MSCAILADTGPLFAAIDPHDGHHNRALRDVKRIALESWVVMVASPVLLEAYSLTLYKLGTEPAATFLSEVLTSGTLVNPSSEDYLAAAAKLAAFPDQSITLVDATLAVLAKRLDVEVWTYDHHFDIMRAAVWR
ncbi:MAG: type II toxin-antitoxin system VapC family toxin [Candidatus Korobacteraceae bacterium]